jgi:hypothetical protein
MGALAFLFTNKALFDFVQLQWVWPVLEILHFVGMAMLIGTVFTLDLRMLGFGKGFPIAPLEKLIPWGIAGFALNAISGYMFIAGWPEGPAAYLNNPALEWKIGFILVGGLNALLFHFTGISRKTEVLGANEDAPLSAKLVAAASIFLWVGVIYLGRMIMYADSFYTPEYFGFGLGF